MTLKFLFISSKDGAEESEKHFKSENILVRSGWERCAIVLAQA